MAHRSKDIKFEDLQSRVLAKVAELHWEQQDKITDEHINEVISDTLSHLRAEAVDDIVFSWSDCFTAPKKMEPADVVRLWIKLRVRKEVEKERKARANLSEEKPNGFKSWFKRRLGIQLVGGVEVVELGNVGLEQIKTFAAKEGFPFIEGNYLTRDSRLVFETDSGQQLLVNDDGSMLVLGPHAGERVILSTGGKETWISLPKNFETLCKDTMQRLVGYKTVEPGFIYLDTNNMIRFDFMGSGGSQSFLPNVMELLIPAAQTAVKEGLFVFSFVTVSMDESVRIITPSFTVG